ncbi:hypothetical protein [Bacillus vallismortis]|uniref:hypothetical protein n=1 Tax=Bacillus vallismortis TaxID=72361 RepID=UPI00227F29C6|nr:hypothetical protein [Bacillus vallismortis]MCY7919955.1 DUF2845 domain-containing protein [Bacillus vallismortis]
MTKKKIIGLVSLLIVFIGLAIVIPMYINRLDTSKLDKIAEIVGSDKEVRKNFDNVWMEQTDKSNDQQFDLNLSAKPSFTSLSDEEKLLTIGKAMEIAQRNSNLNKINCGKDKICSIKQILILPNKNDKVTSYSIQYDPLNNPEENTLMVYTYKNDDPKTNTFESREVTYNENADDSFNEEDSSETPIAIGMTKQDVLNLNKWGKPKDVNKTTTSYGTSEQWVYSTSRYLYFENGELRAIQN